MTRKLHLTVGIPAYNESANIGRELKALKTQTGSNYVLDSCIVVSDASTDQTVPIAKSVQWRKLKVIDHKIRRGKPAIVNDIFARSKSDIIVILDADLTIKDSHLLEKLISPFYTTDKIQLVSTLSKPSPPKSFPERIAYASNQIWEKAITYPSDNEMYFCSGSIRAFGKTLTKDLRFAPYSADDAYTYIACRKLDMEFAYVPDINVFQKLPTTIKDFVSQSLRFLQSQSIQNQLFDQDFVNQFYVVKFVDRLRAALWYFPKDAPATLAYLIMRTWITVLKGIQITSNSSMWQIATSTKK